MRRLKKIILAPPNEGALYIRGYVFIAAGVGFILALLIIPPSWEYSNSPEFCGESCHTMPPEYSTYQVSPHARILCVDCHIGRDLMAVQFSRKIGHTRLVMATILDHYEYPIYSAEMRPARDTCEHCHSPEKFSQDTLREIPKFESNLANDPYSIYLVMHTGGGSSREGLGYGIHWHIENKISYIALDERQQEIPWVRVETPDGEVTEYNSINSPIDTRHPDQYEMYEVDCVTCHNRIAHMLKTPEQSVDSALAVGAISRNIPFIRSRGVELLSILYASTEDAEKAFNTLPDYYATNYPEFYDVEENKVLVDEAVKHLIKLYKESNYPEQLLTWETHPNNIGHNESPGCFRCHDGQHFSSEGEVIRLECNLCHTIPQVVRPGVIEPELPLTTGLEPESHLSSTWITEHHNAFDASCSNCHTITNPGGIDDSSFCSNSACHGSAWEYAGFDAPGLATMMGIYHVEPEPLLEDFVGNPTYVVLQPLFNQQCAACHGANPTKGLRVTDYVSLVEVGSESGAVVIPGAPDESELIETLADGHFANLTDHQFELIRQWIEEGALEGGGDAAFSAP